MYPGDCYRDLAIPFFDDAMVSRLADLAEKRMSDGGFIRYDDYRTPEEFANVAGAIPELDGFVGACRIGCRPLLMFLPPNFSMAVHKDLHWEGNRESSMVVMAYPRRDIAATRFYLGEDRDTHALSAEWRHGQCKLLNIKQWHNVDNGGTWRANLQLSLGRGYDEVIELIRAGELFDGYECRLA